MAAQREPGLEDEEVFEHQPALRRRHERVQLIDVAYPAAGKCAAHNAALRAGHRSRLRMSSGTGSKSVVRQLLERLPHESALHVRRHAAGALVDRNDAAGVQLHFVRFPAPVLPVPGRVLDDLELGIRDLQAARSPDLDLAEQHDALLRLDDVLEERLVRPHRLDLAALVLHQRREQPEPRPARVREAGIQHGAGDRRRHARPQRDDLLHAAAILVAARKAKQQIFDGVEAGLLEIRGLARTDALQDTARASAGRRLPSAIDGRSSGLASTSMRRILAGSSKVSSIDEPFGLSAVRVKKLTICARNDFGIGMPLTSARSSSNLPLPSQVTIRPDAVTGQLAGQITRRIEPAAAALLLADDVEIDDRLARDACPAPSIVSSGCVRPVGSRSPAWYFR